MNFGAKRTRSRAGFDMTPMIDVVFQLIIFFMFTSQFGQLTRSDIELPTERGEQEAVIDDDALVIEITQDGSFQIDRLRLGLDAVGRMVQSEADRAGDPSAVRVLVRADRGAPAGALNRLTGELARSGVRSWQLATAPGGAGGGARGGGGG